MSKPSPFTFISSINNGCKGEHLLEDCKADQSLEIINPDSIEKAYVPFVINRSFSYFRDTVIFANEMNINHTLPSRMQYDFYRNMVKYNKMCMQSEINKAEQRRIDNNDKGERK